MNFIIRFFEIVLYQPFLNILVLFYIYLPGHDFGVAVILLTVLIRAVLSPSSLKAVKSQREISKLQPQIQKIREKYKHNKEQQAQAIMRLYQEKNISPASGCLPILLQLPILIALYQVFLKGLNPETLKSSLYGFVPYPGEIKTTFLGLFDLSRPFWYTANQKTVIYYWPALVLAVLTAIAQFIQIRLSTRETENQHTPQFNPQLTKTIQSQMNYFMPLFFGFIVLKFGSIIGLYLLTSTLLSIGEHYLVLKDEQKTTSEN